MLRSMFFLMMFFVATYQCQAGEAGADDKQLAKPYVTRSIDPIFFSFLEANDGDRQLKDEYYRASSGFLFEYNENDTLEVACNLYKGRIRSLVPKRYQDEWESLNEQYNLSDFIEFYQLGRLVPHNTLVKDTVKQNMKMELNLDSHHKSIVDRSGFHRLPSNDQKVPEDKREARKAFREFFRKCFFKTTEDLLNEFEGKLSKTSALVTSAFDKKKSYISFKKFHDNINNFLFFIDQLKNKEKNECKDKIDNMLNEVRNTLIELLEYCLNSPLTFQGDSIEFFQQNKKHLQEIFALRPPLWNPDADKTLVTFITNKVSLEKEKKIHFFDDMIKIFMMSLYDRGNSVQCFRLWNALSDSRVASEQFSGEIFLPHIMDNPPENDMSRYAVLIQLLRRGLNEKDENGNPMPNLDYFSKVWIKWEEIKDFAETFQNVLIREVITNDRITDDILMNMLDYMYGEKSFDLLTRLWKALFDKNKPVDANKFGDNFQKALMEKIVDNPMPSPFYIPIMTFLYNKLDKASFIDFWNTLNAKNILTNADDAKIEKLLEKEAA